MSGPDVEYTDGLLSWGLILTQPHQWLLVDDSYVPDPDSDQFVADVTGEYAGAGYTRQALTTPVATPAAGLIAINCDPPTFATANDSVHLTHLLLAQDSGVDASDLLIAGWAIDRTTDGTGMTPVLNPGGILAVSATPDDQIIPTP